MSGGTAPPRLLEHLPGAGREAHGCGSPAALLQGWEAKRGKVQVGERGLSAGDSPQWRAGEREWRSPKTRQKVTQKRQRLGWSVHAVTTPPPQLATPFKRGDSNRQREPLPWESGSSAVPGEARGPRGKARALAVISARDCAGAGLPGPAAWLFVTRTVGPGSQQAKADLGSLVALWEGGKREPA